MIVRNWMKAQPVTVTSDTLVSEAKRLLVRNNLRALPVVDDGKLRGLVTRVSCLRVTEFVTRSQDPYEFDYFANKLKVKDIMVRKPAAVQAGDTMEHCLLRGQTEGLSQLPVLDNDKVVGLVSASEIFYMAAQILGVWEKWSGITIEATKVEAGTMSKIAVLVDAAGATLQALYTIARAEGEAKRIIVRFQAPDLDRAVQAFVDAGYKVVEVCSDVQSCRNMARH